jgi:hypothetical protein
VVARILEIEHTRTGTTQFSIRWMGCGMTHETRLAASSA